LRRLTPLHAVAFEITRARRTTLFGGRLYFG
jgi:hypothetical protein